MREALAQAAKDLTLKPRLGFVFVSPRHELKGRGVLVFDCVCRGMILGDKFQREIDAVRKVFPDTPVTGFLTYGEIARFRGRLDGWHNTTTVVTAIPA